MFLFATVNRFFDIILQKFYIFEICPDLFDFLVSL